MYLSVANINIKSKKANNNCSYFYKNQPELPELGVLIFGIDTTLPVYQAQKILNILENLNNNYFLKQDIADPLGCFEKVLNEFNNEFTFIFREQNIWSKKINLTVILLIDKQIHFANYGNNQLLLLRQKNYINIIKQVSANLYIPGKKIFVQIYSGPIANFPRIALINQAIFDYINTDNIKNIFNLLPIQNIESQISQLTNNSLINQNLAGLVMINPFFSDNQEVKNKSNLSLSANETIKNLEIKSAETQKLLYPKYLPDITYLKNKIKNIWPTNKKKLIYNSENKSIIRWNNYANNIYFYLNLTNLNKKIKRSKNNFLNIVKNLPANFVFTVKQFKNKIKLLSGLSKFLLLIASILILALLTNLFLMGIKRNTEINTEYFATEVNKIKNLHSEAQASIIYGDNQKARKLLIAALNSIHNLPKNNLERENINLDLINQNNSLMLEANKIVKLSNLTSIIDIGSINKENLIANGLTIIANNLFIISEKSLYKIDLTNRNIIAVDLPEESPLFLLSDQVNNLLVYFNNNSIYSYELEKNLWQKLNFSWLSSNPPATGAIYNNNIYLVNKENNHIIRYNRWDNSFTSAQTWLGDNNLDKITSLAIDGSIFTWHDNGQINKFIRGKLEKFSVEEIEPNIDSSFLIASSNDLPMLYLLENKNKRIIILNKEGKLIKQYYSEIFNKTIGMTIAQIKENNKRLIYFMDNNNIYELLIDE